MTDAEVLKAIDQAFKGVPRPKRFIEYENRFERVYEKPGEVIGITGSYDDPEAREHEELLQSLDPATLSLSDLPRWGSPLFFLTPEGFQYWFPGFARLTLADQSELDADRLQFILCTPISNREPPRHLPQTGLFDRAQTAATLLLLERLREKLNETSGEPLEMDVRKLDRGIRNWTCLLAQFELKPDVDPYN
jgi:hypothetical protein